MTTGDVICVVTDCHSTVRFVLQPARIELTLHEGRKHQVKRMCEAVGHPVRRLHRSRYAGLGLEGLAPGEWRALAPEEVEALRALVGLSAA